MRVVGISTYVEPALRKAFGSVGVLTSRAPYLILTVVVAALVALSGGNWTVDKETNVNDLLIARRGRIDGEKNFFVDNFDLISPVLHSVIITPKPGVDLFNASTLDEVYALQEHIRTYSFLYKGQNVSLEQFCFKTINADPTEPCWQSSLLESFREGAVFNVGGELNTDYAVLFAAKPSYRDFDFENDLTRSFLAQTNLNPDSLLLGGFEVDSENPDKITHVSALQVLFGAKSPDGLKNDGLQYFEWSERPEVDASGGICPDPTTCEPCADALQPTSFANAGCDFTGSPNQPEACCALLTEFRSSPCVEVIFERRPEVGPIANPLLTACELPIVEVAPRCNNQPLFIAQPAAVSSSDVPEVCVCLAGESDACAAAATAFVGENPQFTEVFVNAGAGGEEEIAELARVLVEDVGCPTEEPVDPICSCLEDISTETCTTAVATFLQENPDQAELFTNAAAEDPAAQEEVGALLVSEFGCQLPALNPIAEPADPICTCLEDISTETCTTAVATFLQENPDQAELFTNAAAEDPAAQEEVGALLVSEFGCELPSINPSAEAQVQQTSEGPVSYQAEVTVVHELTDSIDKARELMHEWEKAWRDQIEDVVAQYQYINVVWITASSVDDEVAEAAEAEFDLFVMGYVLVFAYIVIFVTFDWKLSGVRLAYYPPGPGISTLCFGVVLLSVVAAMGVAGYISTLTSFKISFGTVQMVPLLMLGLGVNDFFVLVQALKSVLASPNCPKTVAEVMYDMMSVGGTSITLSSVANATAFSLGALTAVPIVLWFSVQMAVGIVIAYVVSLVAIPSLLSLSVRRHLEGKPDFVLALVNIHPEAPPLTGEKSAQGVEEGILAAGIRRFRWPLAAVIFAIFAVWMAFGIREMVHFEQGLDISESVQDGSYSHDYLKTSEEYFDTTQINIVFRDSVDYADPADFQSVRRSEFEYVDEGFRTEKQLMSQSWMEFYTQYVETKFCSNEICMNEVEWYYDGFSSLEFKHPSKNICAGVETAAECEAMCQTHCPQGPVDSEFRCQHEADTTNCFCPYRPMLRSDLFFENPVGFNSKIQSYWSDFLVNTTSGRASRIFVNLDDATATERNPMGLPKASRSYVYARGLTSVPRQLDHIQEGREILDRQEVEVYPFDYVVYAVGEQYEDLAVETVEAVGISMAVATVVMMPLIVNFFTAIIVSVCVLLAVLLTAGMSSWTVINLDYSAYVAFIAAVGLSVEFCAHIARDFMLATGDRLTRSLHALRTMGIAVLNGGVTTFLGILPSALSDLPPIRDRLFVQFSIIVLAGLFMGLLVLPTVLSLIGPPSFYATKRDEKEEESKTSTPPAEP